MRRLSFVVLLGLALALLVGVAPALAQNITGLSMRPAEAAPEGAVKGSADIVQSNGGFAVSVDLSSNAEVLKLEDYEGAEAFVAWAVDMDGVPHNVGALDENLTLADAPVDFVVAKLIVTAEASADAEEMLGTPIFQATLRNVEVQAAAGASEKPAAAAAAAAATEKPTAEATAAAAPTAEAKPAKPSELPTTGSVAQDLAILAMLAFALLAVGLRLRTVRF